MSKDSVFEFLSAASSDEALGAQVRGAGDRAALLGVARAHGYEVSREDLDAGLSDVKAAMGEQLGDDELEQVAGGVVEYQDGDDLIVRRRPETRSFGRITLKKGYISSSIISDWM